MSAYLSQLNAAQRQAVEHGVRGKDDHLGPPLLVIAGAGSGKTNTLAHRVAHLLVNGADAGRILLLTFSRRAAAEMERRAERIVTTAMGQAVVGRLQWSGTFHAVGARILRMYAHAIGLDPSFSVHDREDSADLINLVRHEQGLSEKDKRFPQKGTCISIYSRAVNSGEPLETVLLRHFPWCAEWQNELRDLFEAYVTAKQNQQVLDYDDLLLYWAELMSVPELASDVRALFDHVLVDEYQDTNALQARILLGLKPDGRGLTVVGDDAQAIYGFRAADVRNILDFPRLFQPAARLVTLEENYRSTEPILAASNAVIGLAAERFTKNLYSSRAGDQKPALVTVADDIGQANYVVESVLRHREEGLRLKDQAVLVRTGHHSAMLEVELARRNVPFVKFGGLKFAEAAHVKDILAILRWAENPADRVAGFRVLQMLDGIGPGVAGKVMDRMTGRDAHDALATYVPPAKARTPWRDLVGLMQVLLARPEWPSEFDTVRQWYEPHMAQRFEDALVRVGDLDQLQLIASTAKSRTHFLTDLTLDPPDATSQEAGKPLKDEDYLILSTIHSAKGQEWKAVYVLNVVDGCIPSDMSTGTSAEIEEERRLLYVAMTRAKDHLSLVVPHRFYVHGQPRNGDRNVFASRSRFIPRGICAAFEETMWPRPARHAAAPASITTATVDLAARMRGAWRKAPASR